MTVRTAHPHRPRHRRTAALLLAATLSAAGLAACAGPPEAEESAASDAEGFPVEAESCGFSAEIEEPPERAVTLSQGATEVALALGLEDRMVGTAYLDDQIGEEYADAYAQVEVLSEQYPDKESFLALEPDFAFASYGTAFDDKTLGSQDELAEAGVDTYLSSFACGENGSSTGIAIDQVWDEIATVAEVFGVPERAEEIRAEQEDELAEVEAAAAGEGQSVFWFDSGDKAAFAAAGEGGPQIVIEAVGAENVFDEVDGGWAEVPWEDVVAADPDVIVLVDASWSSAESKRERLRTDPALRDMRAVQEDRIVTIPFSESTPGVRLVDGARRVSDQLAELDAS